MYDIISLISSISFSPISVHVLIHTKVHTSIPEFDDSFQ